MSKQQIKKILKKQKKPKKRNICIIFLKLILILIILMLLAVLIAETFAFLYLKDMYATVQADIDKLMVGLNTDYANSIMVDIDGNYLATLNGDEKRQIITLDEMS